MNTLSFPALLARIGGSPAFGAVRAAFLEGAFPLEIDAAEGSAAALLIAGLYTLAPGPFLVVTPTETEAAALAADLSAAAVPASVFP